MIRPLNRLLDGALRVPQGFVLNNGAQRGWAATRTTSLDLAAEMKSAIDALLVDAYDAAIQRFDYARVRASTGYRNLRECAAALREFDLAALQTRQEQLAFWINLYNALIVDAVISFGVKESVTKDFGFFRRTAYCVGGFRFSADDIEHGILRGNRHHPLLFIPQFARDDPRLAFAMDSIEPRIHAALNCASRSCPPIALYDTQDIDAQLDQAMRAFVNSATNVDTDGAIVYTSPIFRWYAIDFGGRDGVLDWLIRGLSDVTAREWIISNRRRLRIKYSRYDWRLNG